VSPAQTKLQLFAVGRAEACVAFYAACGICAAALPKATTKLQKKSQICKYLRLFFTKKDIFLYFGFCFAQIWAPVLLISEFSLSRFVFSREALETYFGFCFAQIWVFG